MPFVEDQEEQIMAQRFLQRPEVESDTPSNQELALAAFKTENIIGSHLTREKGLPSATRSTLDYNPWDYLTDDERLDKPFLENAILAENDEELDAVRRQTEKERVSRETMSKGGAMSFVWGGVAGILDPINLIPVGGTAFKTYKTGSSILRSGMVTGSVASGSTALQEMGLHATQLERTFGESAVNMSAAFLLGGALGVGVNKLSNYGVDKKVLDEIEDVMNVETKIRDGVDSVGAARVADDPQIKGEALRKVLKKTAFDPLTRTMSSVAASTRRAANRLVENVYTMDQHSGAAVESLVKMWDGRYAVSLESHMGNFKAYRNELGQTTADNVLRRGVTRREFAEMVGKEIRNPDPLTSKYVKNSAKKWQKEVYEPLKKEAIDAGLLPDDVDVTTATNYLNRIWNKQKVVADLDGFIGKVSKWLNEEDVNLFHKTSKSIDELSALNKKIDSIRAKGQRADKKDIKRLNELEDLIEKGKYKKGLELEKQDYNDVARQIAQRIMGTPDGRLPYDWKIGDGSTSFKTAGTNLKGPFKTRSFNIPDELMDEFLENDIELVAARYYRQVAPDIELSKAFDGDVEMKMVMKEIDDEWSKTILAEPNAKKRVQLNKKKEADIRDVAAMRDRLRGIYGMPSDHNSIWTRMLRTTRDLNYLRFMGGVVPASIPDVSRVFMAEGFVNTFKHGLKPLIANHKAFKVSAAEGKRYNGAMSALFGGRGELIADIADYTKGGSAFERMARGGAEKFGKINLMDYWTSGVKQIHAVTMQTSIFEGLSKGKIDKRLSRLGIMDDEAKAMWKEVQKHGEKVDGVWITGAKNWDNPHLEQAWGAAMRKESDRVIVMPGQEKPLFMSTEAGKSVMQFKSFMYSATQRVLVAGLQHQDHNFIGGMLSISTLGMMSYAFKQWDAGRELSDDPKAWAVEGIDRSGALGILMELNNTLEKISSNNYGVRPLLGVSAPASRYASRNMAETLAGPTFGSFLSTTLKVVNASTDERDWDESDTRTLRRLLPYQNLALIRQIFDKMEGR